MSYIFVIYRVIRGLEMKILIFGTGNVYEDNKLKISKNDEILGFLDNNTKLWGTKIDGITVFNPELFSNFAFDKIILMSTYFYEMKQQLLMLGCKDEKIVRYVEYINEQSKGQMKIIFPINKKEIKKNRCLIITTDVAYNGGSFAAIYAGMALQQKNYEVIIAAPEGETSFVEEMREKGLNFLLYKNLTHASIEELFWINDFNYIIVNTLQMICCAIEIAKKREVLLWLHEPKDFYVFMAFWREKIKKGMLLDNLRIFAVSLIARKNFIENYPEKNVGIMPYGIPDEFSNNIITKKEKLVFAIVGTIVGIKGQDIFLNAIEKLGEKKKEALFWIIGKNLNDDYGKSIIKQIKKYENVNILGELSHNELIKYYQNIDVLIVPSREDMLPIVVTEAMMLKKVCIVSDIIGTAPYIQEKINGLTFPMGNAELLAEKIIWCIENPDKLNRIGESARNIYESKFSMNIFAENLEAKLFNTYT